MSDSLFHTDFWSQEDYLKFSDFRPVLEEIVTNSSTPLTVGVFGPWGTGKTTLLKLLKNDIDKTRLNRFRTVWFTAWKYDRYNSLWKALLLRVIDSLYPRDEEVNSWGERDRLPHDKLSEDQKKQVLMLQRLEESVYQHVTWQENGGLDINWLQALAAAGKGGAEIASVFYPPAGVLKPLLGLIGTDGSTADEIESARKSAKQKFNTHNRQHLASMEQFENAFQEAIREILGKDGRLIVFIDDLDRCLPEKSVEILETIKLFMEVPGTVFVLGMDKEVIEKGVEVRYKTLFSDSSLRHDLPIRGDIYLQKLIQMPFYLPPLDEGDIESYIDYLEGKPIKTMRLKRHEISASMREKLSPLTRKIISRGVLPNPRQVKRVINIFRLLQGITIVRERKGDLPMNTVAWPLLAKTVIIQTQYPEVYQLWRREPRLIAWLEEEFLIQNNLIYARTDSDIDKELTLDDDLLYADEGNEELDLPQTEIQTNLSEIKKRYLEPFFKPENWQKYLSLERMLSFPILKEGQRPKARYQANFTTIDSNDLSVYLRLAGSVAMESAAKELAKALLDNIELEDVSAVLQQATLLKNEGDNNELNRIKWTLENSFSNFTKINTKLVMNAVALTTLGSASLVETKIDELLVFQDPPNVLLAYIDHVPSSIPLVLIRHYLVQHGQVPDDVLHACLPLIPEDAFDEFPNSLMVAACLSSKRLTWQAGLKHLKANQCTSDELLALTAQLTGVKGTELITVLLHSDTSNIEELVVDQLVTQKEMLQDHFVRVRWLLQDEKHNENACKKIVDAIVDNRYREPMVWLVNNLFHVHVNTLIYFGAALQRTYDRRLVEHSIPLDHYIFDLLFEIDSGEFAQALGNIVLFAPARLAKQTFATLLFYNLINLDHLARLIARRKLSMGFFFLHLSSNELLVEVEKNFKLKHAVEDLLKHAEGIEIRLIIEQVYLQLSSDNTQVTKNAESILQFVCRYRADSLIYLVKGEEGYPELFIVDLLSVYGGERTKIHLQDLLSSQSHNYSEQFYELIQNAINTIEVREYQTN